MSIAPSTITLINSPLSYWRMTLSKSDKEYLRILVKRELEHFEREKIVIDEAIVFLQGEKKYEDFLRELLKKLEE